MNIYDLSFEVETGMPSCGTPWHQHVEVSQLGDIATVGRNTHKILLGSHSGTHMDAPYHFIPGGRTIEQLAIDCFWGPVTVVDMRHKLQGDVVRIGDVCNIEVSKRMLFAFGWYHNWKTCRYYERFPYFSQEAVGYLLEKGMKLIAMDTPSPDDGGSISGQAGADSPNHKALLAGGVVIVEYLNNTDVLKSGRNYEIAALPLKIAGSDGSPARVLAKEVDERTPS